MLSYHRKKHKIPFFLLMGVINLFVHLLTNNQYGFHRDELYFIDCSKHLALGYPDMPPLAPFFAKITQYLFGETLQGLRFFPALISSILVVLTGLMVKEMGGKIYAQFLAMLTIMVAPVYLVAGTMFQTIPFDQFFWVLICYLILRFVNTNNQKLWLFIGLVAGLSLLTKYSTIFLVFALLFGILTSKHRTTFSKIWVWLGVVVELIIFLPNILWQIQHGFPVFEHIQALREEESTPTLQFLFEQLIILHPLNFPIWTTGILFFFTYKNGVKYRLLVWTFIVPLLIFLLMKGKSYYLAAAYPVLLAGGAVAIETLTLKNSMRWLRVTIPSVLFISTLISSPVWLPILSTEKMVKLGIDDYRYDYREMIGWTELVESVSYVYNTLPDKEKTSTEIIAANYGEAGAINYYGKGYGLPNASSGNWTYHNWGLINPNSTTVIFVGYSVEYLEQYFLDIKFMRTINNSYNVENEEQGQLIILCRNPIKPLSELWSEFRHY